LHVITLDNSNRSIKNFLTIDVEDYFQVHAFSKVISPCEWESFDCRIEKNIHYLLDRLDRKKLKSSDLNHEPNRNRKITGTFFILGWIAERYQGLIKEINSRGHEIASHGYGHQAVFLQSPKVFKEDISKSKKILEDLTGSQVFGYRAPTFSITEKTLWALNIIAEEGYEYDSSVFPVTHDCYGIPSAPRFPFFWDLSAEKPEVCKNYQALAGKSGSKLLAEFPISTARFLGYNFPCSGGGYFRFLPYTITRASLKIINKSNKPFMFYLHPWEIDPDIPVVKQISFVSKFRTYINLSRTRHRFERLLQDFNFSSIKDSGQYLSRDSWSVEKQII